MYSGPSNPHGATKQQERAGGAAARLPVELRLRMRLPPVVLLAPAGDHTREVESKGVAVAVAMAVDAVPLAPGCCCRTQVASAQRYHLAATHAIPDSTWHYLVREERKEVEGALLHPPAKAEGEVQTCGQMARGEGQRVGRHAGVREQYLSGRPDRGTMSMECNDLCKLEAAGPNANRRSHNGSHKGMFRGCGSCPTHPLEWRSPRRRTALTPPL